MESGPTNGTEVIRTRILEPECPGTLGRERGRLADQLREERLLVADPGQARGQHRQGVLALCGLLRAFECRRQLHHQQHGGEHGEGVDQHAHQGGVPGQLEGQQHRHPGEQDPRILEAGGDPGRPEKEEHVRVTDVGNRQRPQGGDHPDIGGPQQQPAARHRPANSGQLRIQIEVCDGDESGAVPDGQRDVGKRHHRGRHAEHRDPEHQRKDEVSA